MRKHDQTMICRLPRETRDKTRQMCREMGKTESHILREGLHIVISQYEMKKRDAEMMRQF